MAHPRCHGTEERRLSRLRVLLLSPVASRDPDNGDVTYTEQLLARPPPGVDYVPYDEALEQGTLVERFRRHPRINKPGLRVGGDSPAFVREALVNKLRRRGLLFREPFRHFWMDRASFDLVHVHVFNVNISPLFVPMVVSNSVPVDAMYRDGLGQSARSVAVRRHVDTWLASHTGVVHTAFDHAGADSVVCFSDNLRARFARSLNPRGRNASAYFVVPPGVEPGSTPQARDPTAPFHVGFIGHWEAKGGDLVLEAYRMIAADGIPVRLTVVGSAPRLERHESEELGVSWLPRQPRGDLLDRIVPTFSVFAYPSRFDGLPLTLLEVMAAQTPVVVSDYGALPEIVQFGDAGIVLPGNDALALAASLRRLRDHPALREELGAAARRRILEHYSPRVTSDALRDVYTQTLARRSGG